MQFALRLIVLLVGIFLAPLAVRSDEPSRSSALDSDLRLLGENDIDATVEGVTEYLQSLLPSSKVSAARRQRIRALIAGLGSDEFQEREAATRELIRTDDLTKNVLEALVKSSDREVAWRAKQILAATQDKSRSRDPLHMAVLRTIQELKLNVTASLLAAIPFMEKSYVLGAAYRALSVTAGPRDVALLRQKIDDDDLNSRLGAIHALASVLGADAQTDLRTLLQDDNSLIRLTSARMLANLGDRASLAVLVRLLSDADVNSRIGAISVLRAVTGKQFRYIAYENAENRSKALATWQVWLKESAATAKLRFPLNHMKIETGHTLILLYSKGKVIELNAAGETVWEQDKLNYPWAVQALPNGNRLIGSYRGKFAVEFDAQGKEIWRTDGLPGGVFGIQRLENGNTLMGCHKSRSVIEVNQAGKVVWEAKLDGQPMDVRRLANGHTLTALHTGHKVVEVDSDGRVVWKIEGLGIPRTAQRLENGNTLVSDEQNNRVNEYDRAGNVVWSYTQVDHPYDAQRLSNGQTLITDKKGVRIVDQKGTVFWEKQLIGVGRAVRF